MAIYLKHILLGDSTMKTLLLGAAVSLAAAAAQAAVQPTTTPFLPGESGTIILDCDGGTGAFTVKVQGSDDGVTYTDLLVVSTQGPVSVQDVSMQAYMRLNVTAAGTAGIVSAYIVGGP